MGVQSWTDARLDDAVRVLERSKSVTAACRKLKVTPAALRAAFQRGRERGGTKLGVPQDHVGNVVEMTFKGVLSNFGTTFKGVPVSGAEPPIQRVLVCPDIHIPYHDPIAWDTFLRAAQAYKPHRTVFLGDGADCYEVSDFTKDPNRKHNFFSEMEAVNAEFDRACEAGLGQVDYLLGNHEDRLNRLIAKRAPELHGFTSIPKILRFEERGWNWHEYGEQIQIGKIFFAHDYGPSGGRAVSQALAATGHSVLFGHTHRAQVEYNGTTDGQRHVGMSCGWLGRYDSLAFAYARRWKAKKEWTHSFATVEIDRVTGHGYAQLHPIIDGQVMIGGRLV